MLAGGTIYGVGVNMFIVPNQITVGGATGVTILLNYLTGLSLGTGMILINVPLFLFAFKPLGKEFFFRTLIAMVVMSVMADVFTFVPQFTGDRLLASIYGGVSAGAGLACFLGVGVTTGGSDLLAKIINKYHPYFSMGRLILMIDGLVVIATAIVYQDLTTVFYSIIVIFLTSVVVDKLLDGLDYAKLAIIISNQSDQIADAIAAQMDRGVTALKGTGWYTKEDKNVLMCAVKRYDIHRVKVLVHEMDPDAFMIFTSASEVLGEGFKDYK